MSGTGAPALAAQVVVIAKAPVPGRVKTRLTPPYTPVEAAALAEASLRDTLAAVSRAGVARCVVALDGAPGPWLPPGFDVIEQRGEGLDERIAHAFVDASAAAPRPKAQANSAPRPKAQANSAPRPKAQANSAPLPVVLIGMDTPQVTPALLAAAAAPLLDGSADATFGFAEDGGFWLLGMREAAPAAVLGVPMSREDTGARQLLRLRMAGLRVRLMPELADVDTAADAERIAAEIPDSGFARCLARLRAPVSVLG